MPGPNGIIMVKGSFKLSDLCDKEFHKMAQNFGMMANYGELKDKAKSATTGVMACKYNLLGTPRGRYDEHSSKSSLSCETKV
jgi:hypothetical protein